MMDHPESTMRFDRADLSSGSILPYSDHDAPAAVTHMSDSAQHHPVSPPPAVSRPGRQVRCSYGHFCAWILMVSLLAFTPKLLLAGAEPGFQAHFELKVKGVASTDLSSGQLEYLEARRLYLNVKAPTEQQIWVEEGLVTLYYPERKLVFRGETGRNQLPMFDSLAVGIRQGQHADLSRAKLVEQRQGEDGKLQQRWSLHDEDGKSVGSMAVVEGPGGVEEMAIRDDKEVLLRKYHLGPRVALGPRTVPTWIVGEYLTPRGTHIRIETWTLSDFKPLPPPTRRKAGRVPVLPTGIETRSLEW